MYWYSVLASQVNLCLLVPEDDPEIPTTKHNRSNNLTKCRTGKKTVQEIELEKVRECANRKVLEKADSWQT